ncbi:MAG TPA: hypothetical protein VIZ17_18600 [Acetobacteraceae bacterium]
MPSSEPTIPTHGGAVLPEVTVETYNAELRDADGFLGDRASNRAFRSILQDWRERVRQVGEDPIGAEEPDTPVGKRKLDKLLMNGDPEAAGLVHSAVEEFAGELATVCRRLLRLKAWRKVDAIVIGGGFRASRIGEIAIGRALALLKADGRAIELRPIRHHPDEAGLIGCAHLAPTWVFSGHDSIIGVDIGGTNFRAGVVALGKERADRLRDAKVRVSELWRHGDDAPSRDEALDRLTGMLNELIRTAAKKGWRLAPFIGIGCPGLIASDGSIDRGGQNLPGDWESAEFNLPERIRAAIPEIDGHDTMVMLHNDAVVQGLSEAPWMQEANHWGALTIGTGLGNACFQTRQR